MTGLILIAGFGLVIAGFGAAIAIISFKDIA